MFTIDTAHENVKAINDNNRPTKRHERAVHEIREKDTPEEISAHSQNMMIKKFLEAGGRLTQREAIERPFHCYRLSARIWDLRHKERYGNMKIRTDRVGHGEKLFASYSLIREEL